jgi:hypothetical protein
MRSCAEIQAEIAEVQRLKAVVSQKLLAKSRRMQDLFRTFDANRDGTISHDEISSTLERLQFCFNDNQTAAVTRWIDKDNSDAVKFHDFARRFDGQDEHNNAAPAPYIHEQVKDHLGSGTVPFVPKLSIIAHDYHPGITGILHTGSARALADHLGSGIAIIPQNTPKDTHEKQHIYLNQETSGAFDPAPEGPIPCNWTKQSVIQEGGQEHEQDQEQHEEGVVLEQEDEVGQEVSVQEQQEQVQEKQEEHSEWQQQLKEQQLEHEVSGLEYEYQLRQGKQQGVQQVDQVGEMGEVGQESWGVEPEEEVTPEAQAFSKHLHTIGEWAPSATIDPNLCNY